MRRKRSVLVPALVAVLAGCGPTAPSVDVPAVLPTEIVIVAEAIEFDPPRLELPANVPLRIVLDNRDEGVPHALAAAVRTSGVPPTSLGESEIVIGPARLSLDLSPLSPGPYLFTCPVHPLMQIEVDVR
jgi:hypothetical protein